MSQQDRPASLRRTPRPARDERVDPIDTRSAASAAGLPASAAASLPASAGGSLPVSAGGSLPTSAGASLPASAAAPRGRRRGAEPTVSFSSRIALDVDELLHDAVASGRAGTIRAALEEAIRKTWG